MPLSALGSIMQWSNLEKLICGSPEVGPDSASPSPASSALRLSVHAASLMPRAAGTLCFVDHRMRHACPRVPAGTFLLTTGAYPVGGARR